MSNDKKTLVILTPGFAENEDDTTCLPAHQQFIKALNKNFPSVKVIILAFQYPYTLNEYRWNSNAVIPFNGRNKKKLNKFFLWFRVWKTLKKIRKENQIVGLLSFWCNECALIGKRFGKKYSISHYCWILGQDARKGNGFVKLIRPQAGDLIALSDFIQKEFEKNYNIKPQFVIPLGIEPVVVKDYVEKDIDVLAAGSLIPLKQYGVFIDVIKGLTQQLPGLKAILCGKGPEEIRLNAMIEKLQLKKNIVLAGEKPHAELLQLMRRTKVFLHTSSYEGFGIVCLEALYAGAQVISFCKPMNEEVAKWHIVKNKEEMIQKAKYLLQTPPESQESILPWSIDNTAIEIIKLFNYKEVAIL